MPLIRKYVVVRSNLGKAASEEVVTAALISNFRDRIREAECYT
jgi:hypothetical protein